MKTEFGFTMVEMVITIVLTAILAGVVMEVVRGPLLSFFLVNKQAVIFENAVQVMESLSGAFENAWFENNALSEKEGIKTLQYRKVIYHGVAWQDQRGDYIIAQNQLASLDKINKNQDIFLVSQDTVDEPLHRVKQILNNRIILSEYKSNEQRQSPHYIYLVSEPIKIEFNQNKQMLTLQLIDNESNMQTSLLGNDIGKCDFSLNKDSPWLQVFVRLSFKRDNQELSLFQLFHDVRNQ